MKRVRDAFDLQSAVLGALLMGSIVWWINASHGALPATTAASKQAAYTFFMGGVIMRLATRLAERNGPRWLVVALATLIPTAVTVGATFFVHSLKGTPEPLASTVPVALLSPPVFAGWAVKTRKNAADGARRGVPS